jgi:hypothetical protein
VKRLGFAFHRLLGICNGLDLLLVLRNAGAHFAKWRGMLSSWAMMNRAAPTGMTDWVNCTGTHLSEIRLMPPRI